MSLYIYLAIAVNFVWGLAFLVPYYLHDVHPVIIVFGRYLVYGLISFLVFASSKHYWRTLTKKNWQRALFFAFAGNIGYYLSLTVAIRYAGIATTALIVGTLPITMALYGNWMNKEFPFRVLFFPILFILFGMTLLNWFQYAHVSQGHPLVELVIGSCFALIALLLWTWYGVANACYMKENPHISSNTWSIAVGVSCLLQAIIVAPALWMMHKVMLSKGIVLIDIQDGHKLFQIVIGSLILGMLVSWLSAIGWNKISRHLPTTLAAQLIVFETISSLIYGFLLDHKTPQLILLISVFIILSGVMLGIRAIQLSQLARLSQP